MSSMYVITICVIASSSTAFVRAAVMLPVVYVISILYVYFMLKPTCKPSKSMRFSNLALHAQLEMSNASCMATIDGIDKGCSQVLCRVKGNSPQPGISGTTITTTPSRTSTAIRRSWFSGTSLPRRVIWRRRRQVASELSHFVGQVEFLLSLPRCWQSHAPPPIPMILRWYLMWNASS